MQSPPSPHTVQYLGQIFKETPNPQCDEKDNYCWESPSNLQRGEREHRDMMNRYPEKDQRKKVKEQLHKINDVVTQNKLVHDYNWSQGIII